MIVKIDLDSVETQLADCVTVYCIAGLKTRGKRSWEEVTGSFWRLNYRRDPEILYWISLFNTTDERNRLLKRYFDVDISHRILAVEEYHQEIMKQLEQGNLPLVFVNRFDMPYDKIGYQTLEERHYVLVQGYDIMADEYLLVDFFNTPSYNRVTRSILQSTIAKSLESSQPLLVGKLNDLSEDFTPDQVKEILRGNFLHMTNELDPSNHSAGMNALNSLSRDIDSRDGYLDEYVASLNLFSKLKHVGTYRVQHARFLEKYLGATELSRSFTEMGQVWNLLANDLLKAHLSKQDRLVVKSLQRIEDLRAFKQDVLRCYSTLI